MIFSEEAVHATRFGPIKFNGGGRILESDESWVLRPETFFCTSTLCSGILRHSTASTAASLCSVGLTIV